MSDAKTTERFPSLSIYANPVEMEKAIIEWWEEHSIFEKTQKEQAHLPSFVFYDGPPTANGSPGVHHIISRLAKDSICRFKSMTGHHVLRKAGWDTHGLPVELEVQKALGLKDKSDILKYGVANFNAKCRESVFTYEKEWREMTRRTAYWLDLDNPYITLQQDYIESVWHILKSFFDAGLIYQGYKVMPYNPRLGTVYSSHEVAQGYAEVTDPSITFRLRLKGRENESLLVWTTTPWTLLSNVAAAVSPSLDYMTVQMEDGEKLTLAEARLEALGKVEYEIVARLKGRDLVGLEYERLYDQMPLEEGKRAAVVVEADFVSAEDGTGIVHMAPAYGADDYDVGRKQNLAFVVAVGADGRVDAAVEPFAGLDFKAADSPIMKDLKARGLLYAQAQVKHTYPHCWRDKGPLMYFAQPAWFIETTKLKDKFIEANNQVNWYPEEVGRHRFGNWLEGNIDWALSRDRFWGTPLPIWQTEDGKNVCVGSVEELKELAGGTLPENFDVHKPFIDELELKHPETGQPMKRVPEVIDAWFDSGAMPFAQWHWPFENEELFEDQIPADFICEGIDQSRGWFYSLLVISVFMRGTAPYKNVLVNEMVLDAKGKKMSKSQDNRVDPWEVLDAEGGDAIRMYMAMASPIWQPLKFDKGGPREMNSKTLGTLRNTYGFLALYANLDGWTPGLAEAEFTLLDRWIRSRFESLVDDTRRHMEAYDITRALKGVSHFVMEELSNWYVRRNRRRFWKGELSPDKAAAYETLYGVLEGVCRLAAPFVPFVTEAIWRNLQGEGAGSVHLADYPEVRAELRDPELEEKMEALLSLVGLGRSLRNVSGQKVRQPLSEFQVTGPAAVEKLLQDEELVEQLADELNVKRISFLSDPGDRLRLVVKPRFKVLGPKLGGSMKAVAAALAVLDGSTVQKAWDEGSVSVEADGREFSLSREELDFSAEAAEPWVGGMEGRILAALNTELDEALEREGIFRELTNRVQNLRKSEGLEVSDRIAITWQGDALFAEAMAQWGNRLCEETLALSLQEGGASGGESFEIAGKEIRIEVRKA
jgi:isoleucyl-tRNA synthetase